MSVDESKSRSFPMLAATAWWGLRSRWQKSMPGRVDAQYVETVLKVKEKSAKNIVPQLRALGLIDDEGKPTPLANGWRTDEGYPEACKQIIESVYPQQLRDAVPPEANLDKDAAARWFVRERKVGEGAGRQMAALYALIAVADPAGAENVRTQRTDRSSNERTSRTAGTSRRQTGTTGTAGKHQQQMPPPPPQDERRSLAPSLHIDVQVHIPSDATPEQIDAIFASMAKHLYSQHQS